MDYVTLHNGVSMPVLGLGVYKTTRREEMEEAVSAALGAGYRLFDTAQMYQNEALLGAELKRGGVPRQELFLTSKIDTGNMAPAALAASFTQSLHRLGTDYLDLLLIHWPGQNRQRLTAAWAAMEALYATGRVRAIGVCNCLPRHLEWIMEGAAVIPAVNQIERHPLGNQNPVAAWCRARGIQPEAWSPLLRGRLDMPLLLALAEKHRKTPAQIVLRWQVQSGCVVIPKSVHRARVEENMQIFDFTLTQEDMDAVDALDEGHHISRRPDSYDY